MTAPTREEVLKARLVLALDQQAKINAQVVELTSQVEKLAIPKVVEPTE